MDEPPPKPRGRWLRFSLRSLLLLVVLIAVPLGWKVNRARNQRAAVAGLQKLRAQITYDYENASPGSRANAAPPGPKWLIDLLGKEYFADVVQVTVGGPQVADDTIALIARLPEVEHVTLAWVSRRPGLDQISTLKQLDDLGLLSEAADITDKGMAYIAKLTKLRSLCLRSGSSDGSGVQDRMKITDQGLLNLHELKHLEFVQLQSTQVTQAGIDTLRKALPNCRIDWNPKVPLLLTNEKDGKTTSTNGLPFPSQIPRFRPRKVQKQQ